MAFKTEESLDTNMILRLMLNDIPGQRERAVDLLCRPGVTYRIEDLAITEAVYVLQTQDRTRTEIARFFEALFKRMNLKVNFRLFERVFPMYLACPKLSFNDCCLAGYAALNEAEPLWTLDKALAKESGTAKMLE